jgi:hypothetical protein
VVTTHDQAPVRNALIDASELFDVTDADLDTIEKFAFWDDVAGPASGSFMLDGVAQGAQQEIVVDAADLDTLQFQAGDSPAGWDYLYVRAFDGTSWSAWKGVGVNPVNAAPVVTAHDQTPATNAFIDASALFSVTDADFDTIEKFAFWDDVAGSESGSFMLEGVEQEIVVDAADLALLQFQAGDSPSGWDYLYVRAFDGTSWSEWTGVGVYPNDLLS